MAQIDQEEDGIPEGTNERKGQLRGPQRAPQGSAGCGT